MYFTFMAQWCMFPKPCFFPKYIERMCLFYKICTLTAHLLKALKMALHLCSHSGTKDRNTKPNYKLLSVQMRKTVFGFVCWPTTDWAMMIISAKPYHNAALVVIVATWQTAQEGSPFI